MLISITPSNSVGSRYNGSNIQNIENKRNRIFFVESSVRHRNFLMDSFFISKKIFDKNFVIFLYSFVLYFLCAYLIAVYEISLYFQI